MSARLFDYAYIAATIVLTVYGQVVLKWRVRGYGALPEETIAKFRFLFGLFLDPFVLSGIFAAFLASLAWMAAMTKFELTHAYPFMSLNFVVVLLLSVWLLGEPLTIPKVLGVALIVAGTVVVARG
ncbi:MAG: EamA family transporter [Devosia nanyangense]|uniref:EamA family transporter n=1 Tax=Devosia nanyangense TaxID=1228055 RepID=A0A933L0X8_9HYPH|nr:EamA family transporter [Devosia nanyangense]